jgi:hypothetical protein
MSVRLQARCTARRTRLSSQGFFLVLKIAAVRTMPLVCSAETTSGRFFPSIQVWRPAFEVQSARPVSTAVPRSSASGTCSHRILSAYGISLS